VRRPVFAFIVGFSLSSLAIGQEFTTFRSGQIGNGAYDSRTDHLNVSSLDKFLSNSNMDESWAHARMAFPDSAMAWGMHACAGPANPSTSGQAYAYASSELNTTYTLTSATLAVGTIVNLNFSYRYNTTFNMAYNGSGSLSLDTGLIFNIGTPANANAIRSESRKQATGGGSSSSSGLYSVAPSGAGTQSFQARIGNNISLSILGWATSSVTATYPKANAGDSQSGFTWGFSSPGTDVGFFNPNGNPPGTPLDPLTFRPNNPVPEPATLLGLGSGLVVLLRRRSRR